MPSAKFKEPIENITTYKPFSIWELTIDIFGERETKVQTHIKELESKGMQRSASAYRQPSNTRQGVKVRFDDSGSDRGSVSKSRFRFGSRRDDWSEVDSIDMRSNYRDDRSRSRPPLGNARSNLALPPRADSRRRDSSKRLNLDLSFSNTRPLDLSSDMSEP